MKKRAFTLVELLVLICIIGVLVALTLPAIFAVQKQVQAAPAPPEPYRYVATIRSGPLVWELTHEGNRYLVVRYGDGVSICPALPPKAEKEPGHAE